MKKNIKKIKERRDFYLAGSFLCLGYAIAVSIYIQNKFTFIPILLLSLMFAFLKEKEDRKLKGGKKE